MTRIDVTLFPGHPVLGLLTRAGHQAFVVGGPVRNALLGVPVDDLDLATDAPPDVVMTLAKDAGIKAIPTGIAHGTVTLVWDGFPVEVTTFRRDVATDGRRAVVAYAKTIAEDAMRRDFTMNALYADQAGQVHDPLGGMDDLQARRVRFIGDPAARIREDYLRILRFFRFHAWYGDPAGGLDADGLAACAALADGLASLSKERITAEILKLLAAPDPTPALAAMDRTGILARVLPGATMLAVGPLVHLEGQLGVAPSAIRRLAALGGAISESPLKLSKKQNIDLHKIAQHLPEAENAMRLGYLCGADIGRDVVLVAHASLSRPLDPSRIADVAAGAALTCPIRAADLPHLEGPALGKALKTAEADWIASGFALSRDELVARTRE